MVHNYQLPLWIIRIGQHYYLKRMVNTNIFPIYARVTKILCLFAVDSLWNILAIRRETSYEKRKITNRPHTA